MAIEDKFPYYAGGRSGLPGRAPGFLELWNSPGTGADGQRGKTPNILLRAPVNNQFHGAMRTATAGTFLLPGAPVGGRPHFYGYTGWLGTPKLARAQITTVPAEAAITDNSLLTIPAGSIGAARDFEFDTNASGLTVGDVLVDLAGLVTSAQVAAALAAAINGDIANSKCWARSMVDPAAPTVGVVNIVKLNFSDPGSENAPLVFSVPGDGWLFAGFGGAAGDGYLTGAIDIFSGSVAVEGNLCQLPVHIGPNCWAIPCSEGELDQFDPPDPE